MQISQKALEKRIKRHVRSRTQRFYAVVPPGFEEAACRELEACGIYAPQSDRGGVAFSGKWEECWKAHHRARIPARILVRLSQFTCLRFDQLETQIKEFPWELWLQPHQTPAFQVDAQQSALYHEGAIQERVKGWIETHLQPWKALSPEGDPKGAAQTIHIRNFRNRFTISLDCSGELLYKRGYEKHVDAAPLRDNIAAAILQEMDFAGFDTLVDPMAGSGSFGLEALLTLAECGAGHLRHFAFENFPVFRPAAYRYFLNTASPAKNKAAKLRSIVLCDVQKRSIEIVHHNLQQLAKKGVDIGSVRVEQADFFQTGREFISAKTLICLNPPYGERLQAGQNTRAFFAKLGQHLRRHWKGCSFAIIAPGKEAERALGLPVSRKILFYNGGISAALLMGTFS